MAQTQQTKVATVTKGRDLVTYFANVAKSLGDWRDAYLGRGLQSGGVNELTDADIAELGLTAAEVAELSTLVADLNTFFTVARRGVVARLRNDF